MFRESQAMFTHYSKAPLLLLLALHVSCVRLDAIESQKINAEYLKNDRSLKEAWAKASGFMQQLSAIESVEDANALARELSESICNDAVLWETLRRKGFMELNIFWEEDMRRPTFFNLIQDLKKKGFLTPDLRQAIEDWHARLGHHFSIWTHRQPLQETELAWLRQDLSHELRLFREAHSASIGAGDGLSNETPLTILVTNDDAVYRLAIQFARTVGKCGIANYALFSHKEGDDTRIILQIYGIQWETGDGYIFYFDVTAMIPRRTR